MSGPPSVRILTVCSHNRTRSVMIAALLTRELDERLGAGEVKIRSSGFGPAGLPAIPEAVAAMRRRGLDVSAHRSSPTERAVVEAADLVITAERDHVVRVAALAPASFGRTLTMPELLQRVDAVTAGGSPLPRADGDGGDGDGRDGDGGVRAWAAGLTAGRTAGEYLRGPVPEVADPTGTFGAAFERAVVEIERQCVLVADVVARAASSNIR